MSIEVSVTTRLRERLRLETDDIHQRLHRNPAMLRLMSDECTHSHYLDVLKAFFIFYTQSEDFYRGLPSAQRFAQEAKPLEWLQKDFSVAGIDSSTLAAQALALEKYRVDYTNSEPTLATYLGYLYVKQGSTLGGQMISKRLHKTLALDAGQTQHFFYGFGADTGIKWQKFLEYLSDAESKLSADDVVLSARNHFLNLEYLFNQFFTAGDENGNR